VKIFVIELFISKFLLDIRNRAIHLGILTRNS